MNSLIINQSDTLGGAAIAGKRLHQALLAQGIESRLLVGIQTMENDRVAEVPRKRCFERNLQRLTYRLGLNYLNHQTAQTLPQHPFYQSADILNFHNLHNGYFNYLSLPKLTRIKPGVLTLHDMWSFTGHCGYSHGCKRWKTGCGRCPHLDTYPEIPFDNTRLELKLKRWSYERSNLTIVTLSHWLTQQVQQSVLRHFPIHHIPNGIDTETYQPSDPEQCRKLLGIPPEKHVLMFAAADLQERRKGGDLLLAALRSLPLSLKAESILLMLGNGGTAAAREIGIPIVELGYVSSDRLKAIAYSAADLFLFPTRADNLPLVLQESMACGTPMVSFDVGGVPDLVRPEETGYLAAPENTEDFSAGIIRLLEDRERLQQMRQRCREIALAEYPLELQAQRYIELYRSILSRS